MALIRYMEVETESIDLIKIPIRNAQIVFCKDTLNVYMDSMTSRINLNIIIRVSVLPDEAIDPNKLYYDTTDNKIYRFIDSDYEEVNTSSEIYDIIAKNEDVLACYLTKDGYKMAPYTFSELVSRPDGETIESTMIGYEKEIVATLNPYLRRILINTAGQTTFIIPLPHKHFFLETNAISIYKNNVLLGIDDYTLNVSNSTFTLATPTIVSDELNVVFHYIKSNTYINRFRWVIEYKDQTSLIIPDFSYAPGTDSTSLYLNGIKQPISAYTEVNSTSIKLKASVPVGTIIDFEAGKIESADNFFDSFVNKSVNTIDANTEETVFDNDNYGRPRKIVKTFTNGKVTAIVAYVDGTEIIRQNVTYSGNIANYTVIRK